MFGGRQPGGNQINASLVGEFNRIGDQIHKNLPQAGHIAVNQPWQALVDEISQLQILFARFHREQAEHLLDGGLEIKQLFFHLHFP
ncbi:hypothetical protein D3C75_659430 [compost metagenome]